MDYYVNELNPGLLNGHAKDTITYGNWPATMADAWMTVGVLADDRARYEPVMPPLLPRPCRFLCPMPFGLLLGPLCWALGLLPGLVPASTRFLLPTTYANHTYNTCESNQ